MDELIKYQSRIKEDIWEAISSNCIEFNPSMKSKVVKYESVLHFDDDNASNLSFNEEMSVSHDNISGTNIEPQEMSIKGPYLTSLEKCLKIHVLQIILLNQFL